MEIRLWLVTPAKAGAHSWIQMDTYLLRRYDELTDFVVLCDLSGFAVV